MRLTVIDSVGSSLRSENREMSEWNDRQNELLYGKKNNNSPLEREEDEAVLIGGDLNIEVVPKTEESKLQLPSIPQLPVKSSGIKDIILSTMAGLGLLTGGVGIGTIINSNSTKSPAPSVDSKEQSKEDLDTIGVLEPDR